MYKLVILIVALLALFAPSSNAATTAAATMSNTISATTSGSVSLSLSSSLTNSGSYTTSASISVSLTNSGSSSLSQAALSSGAVASSPMGTPLGTPSGTAPPAVTPSMTSPATLSASASAPSTLSATFTNSISTSLSTTITASSTKSQSQTPSTTGTKSPSSTVTNTISGTQSVTQTGSISPSFSASVSAAPSITATMSAAPPPTALAQVTAGCGNSRKMLCVSWSRPSGVPAQHYLVTLTATVSGQNWVQNFTMGETFAMFRGLQPSTAYVVSVQTIYFGTLSSAATLSITTNSPSPKQLPSLGITAFSCRSAPQVGNLKKRMINCSWTNGAVSYTTMNLRIKCTGKAGSAFDGKNRKLRVVVKSGASAHMEKGFFPNARCKVIMNPAYATGPGRRVVQVLEVV